MYVQRDTGSSASVNVIREECGADTRVCGAVAQPIRWHRKCYARCLPPPAAVTANDVAITTTQPITFHHRYEMSLQ